MKQANESFINDPNDYGIILQTIYKTSCASLSRRIINMKPCSVLDNATTLMDMLKRREEKRRKSES